MGSPYRVPVNFIPMKEWEYDRVTNYNNVGEGYTRQKVSGSLGVPYILR